MPVYAVWVAPELFNFALGLLAYFFLAHKAAATTGARRRDGRAGFVAYGPASDWLAAALIGLLTFSKVTNCLLLLPIVGWYAWRRRWRHALTTGVVRPSSMGLFGINTAITGDWNYQGGARSTFYVNEGFPFQTLDKTFDVGDPRARNEGRGDVILDPDMFWINLRRELWYFVVGPLLGHRAYFLPALFAIVAFLRRSDAARRRGSGSCLRGLIAQILLFIVSQPYTYFGSGGSVGNRYFMGVYGLALFLLPPLTSVGMAFVPWLVGGLFTASSC